MRTIYKYPVSPSLAPNVISAPGDFRPLALGVQGDALVVWAEVGEPGGYPHGHEVMVVGTGWDYDHTQWEYVATAQDRAGFVWHLLKVKA
jgi:hypothetical protein